MVILDPQLKAFRFDTPILVLAESLRVCRNEEFANGASFVAALRGMAVPVLGIILPLELQTPSHYAQELFGLDLLEWSRWAGSPLEQMPVLALSWFSFEKIQRLRSSLLLSHSATQFVRLPAPAEALERFIQSVRLGNFDREGGAWETVRGGPSIDSVLTHHDLANDYYGAYRLWVGYGTALRQTLEKFGSSADLSREIHVFEGVQFEWIGRLKEKLSQPHVRRFQAQAERDEFPAYPEPNDQENSDAYQLLISHLDVGLGAGTRLLFIDDQFKKGWAEVLLRVLFRVDSFTYETGHEAVYAEVKQQSLTTSTRTRWARFVSVDSAERARLWLDYWGTMPLKSKGARAKRSVWLDEWAQALNTSVEKSSEPEDILGHSEAGSIDAPSARPKDVSTIALLDLRLESQHHPRIFNVADLDSIRLRSELKTHQPTLPIIMFTASRHAITATQIMRNSNDADGWYVKEAPDVPPNDENTARGFFYLLDRIHLFSQLHLWYRDSLEWDSERKLEYAHFFNSPHRKQVLQNVDDSAGQIFEQVRLGVTGWDSHGYRPSFLEYIQEHAPAQRFDIELTLVARRVALATLLLTAIVKTGELQWNADEFDRVLPGRRQNATLKAVYDKLNFNRVLWLRTRDIHTQLLPEEFRWLAQIDWPQPKRIAIQKFLDRVEAEVMKKQHV
jgi:hypothetical protein